MAAPDDDPDAQRRDAPLADVVAAIDEQQADRPEHAEQWRRLEARVGDRDTDTRWERLASESTASADDIRAIPEPTSGNSTVSERLSTRDIGLSLTTAVLTILSAAAIQLSAMMGVLPEHLWVLALLPLTIGLVLLVPIITYHLGIWSLRDLSYADDRLTNTDDLPSPDRLIEE